MYEPGRGGSLALLLTSTAALLYTMMAKRIQKFNTLYLRKKEEAEKRMKLANNEQVKNKNA